MPPAEVETTVSAGERLQTYALDRVANWTGITNKCYFKQLVMLVWISNALHKNNWGGGGIQNILNVKYVLETATTVL